MVESTRWIQFHIFLFRRGGMVHMLFDIFIQSWGRGRYILIYFHPVLGRGGFIQLSGRQPPSQLGGTCPTQCQTLETHIVHNVETLETQQCCKQTLLSRQIAKHLTHNNTPLLQTHII